MIIYFDMDGVLVDFYSQKAKIDAPSNTQFWKQVSKIGISFWTTMSERGSARQLVEVLKKQGYNLGVLSKLPITDTGNAFLGKSKWLYDHYLDVFTTVILTKHFKGIYARTNDILIDDKIENIKDWTRHGGTGLLMTPETTFESIYKELQLILTSHT